MNVRRQSTESLQISEITSSSASISSSSSSLKSANSSDNEYFKIRVNGHVMAETSYLTKPSKLQNQGRAIQKFNFFEGLKQMDF